MYLPNVSPRHHTIPVNSNSRGTGHEYLNPPRLRTRGQHSTKDQRAAALHPHDLRNHLPLEVVASRPYVQRVQRDGQERQEKHEEEGGLEQFDPVGGVEDRVRGLFVRFPLFLVL